MEKIKVLRQTNCVLEHLEGVSLVDSHSIIDSLINDYGAEATFIKFADWDITELRVGYYELETDIESSARERKKLAKEKKRLAKEEKEIQQLKKLKEKYPNA
jgi:FMN-dependent NADH-azoreductase